MKIARRRSIPAAQRITCKPEKILHVRIVLANCFMYGVLHVRN